MSAAFLEKLFNNVIATGRLRVPGTGKGLEEGIFPNQPIEDTAHVWHNGVLYDTPAMPDKLKKHVTYVLDALKGGPENKHDLAKFEDWEVVGEEEDHYSWGRLVAVRWSGPAKVEYRLCKLGLTIRVK